MRLRRVVVTGSTLVFATGLAAFDTYNSDVLCAYCRTDYDRNHDCPHPRKIHRCRQVQLARLHPQSAYQCFSSRLVLFWFFSTIRHIVASCPCRRGTRCNAGAHALPSPGARWTPRGRHAPPTRTSCAVSPAPAEMLVLASRGRLRTDPPCPRHMHFRYLSSIIALPTQRPILTCVHDEQAGKRSSCSSTCTSSLSCSPSSWTRASSRPQATSIR